MNRYRQLLSLLLLVVCVLGCQDARRAKAIGVDQLNLDIPAGIVKSVREVPSDGLEIVIEPKSGSPFHFVAYRDGNNAVMRNIMISNQYADSRSGAGYVVIDNKGKYLTFVWVRAVFIEDFAYTNLPDEIEVGGEMCGQQTTYGFRYGGMRVSPISGVYSLVEAKLPDWIYKTVFQFGS